MTKRPAISVAVCLGGELFFYGLFWSGIVLALLTLNVAANGVFGTVEASVWAGGFDLTRYLFVAAGAMVIVACLPMYVAQGITRRAFIAGAIPAGLAVAFLATGAATAVYGLEGVVYDIADWPHVLDAGRDRHLYDRPDDYGPIFVELFAVYSAQLMSGMAIAATFYRFGPVIGVLFVPLTALPAVATEMALGAGGAGQVIGDALDLTPPAATAGLLVSAGALVAGGLGIRALVKDITIDNQTVVWWR